MLDHRTRGQSEWTVERSFLATVSFISLLTGSCSYRSEILFISPDQLPFGEFTSLLNLSLDLWDSESEWSHWNRSGLKFPVCSQPSLTPLMDLYILPYIPYISVHHRTGGPSLLAKSGKPDPSNYLALFLWIAYCDYLFGSWITDRLDLPLNAFSCGFDSYPGHLRTAAIDQ